MMPRPLDPIRRLPALFAAACLLLAAACASPNELSSDTAEMIDDGANRIILEREELTEMLTADAPAVAFYRDAKQHFRNNGFELVTMDDDELIFNTDAREIDGQMIKFNVHVQPAPGGSQLVAEAMYMPPAGATYTTASWTEPAAQNAFGSAMSFLAGLSHSDLAFATQ